MIRNNSLQKKAVLLRAKVIRNSSLQKKFANNLSGLTIRNMVPTYVGSAELLSDNIYQNLKNALSSTHLRGLSWTGEQPPTSAGSRLVCNHTSLQHTFLNHEYTQKINSKNRSY